MQLWCGYADYSIPVVMFAPRVFFQDFEHRGCEPTIGSPPLLSPSRPLEVGPLNPAKGSEERCKLPQWGQGGAPAEIKFGAF